MLIEMTEESSSEVELSVRYTQIRVVRLADTIQIEFLNKKNLVVGRTEPAYVGHNDNVTINGVKGKLDLVRSAD